MDDYYTTIDTVYTDIVTCPAFFFSHVVIIIPIKNNDI